MLPATVECRRPAANDRTEKMGLGRSAHTSHAVGKHPQEEAKRTLQFKALRSLGPQSGQSLAAKRTTPGKLPPLSKTREQTASAQGKTHMISASQGKLTLNPIRRRKDPSDYSHAASILSKSLQSRKGLTSTTKSMHINRNVSMDLDDFAEKFSRPQLLHARCLIQTLAEVPQLQVETYPEMLQRTARREGFEYFDTNACLTLRPGGGTSQKCSCSAMSYLQKHIHYRQLFARKGPAKPLPALYPLYIDKYPGINMKPTLILNFEGALGDCYKRCLIDTSPKTVRVRKNSVVGLQWLQQNFNLVLVTALCRSRTIRIVNHYRKSKVSFLAAYRIEGGKSTVLDYARVLEDLGVNEAWTMVVGGLDVAYDDLLPVAEETLYTKAGTEIRLMATGVPVGRSQSLVAFLVPSLRAQAPADILSFDQVAAAIQHFRKSHSWESDFRRLQNHPNSDLQAISTTLAHEVVLAHTLNFPRADAVRKGLPDHCELHGRPQWTAASDPPPSSLVILTVAPGAKGGFDTIESKALRVKSGFLNLLDYTTVEGSARTVKPVAKDSI